MDMEYMRRYREAIKDMPDPIRLKDCPKINFDMRGIMAYAKKQGKHPIELSEEEQQMFIKD